MTDQEADLIIDEALSRLGQSTRLGDDYFLDARFATVQWVPTYVRRIGATTWGIELYRGDRIPDATVAAMQEAMWVDATVQPAFFVPEGDIYDHLLTICHELGIALIARIADSYECVMFRPAVTPAHAAVARIPEWVLTELEHLTALALPFRSVLKLFAKKYRHMMHSGTLDDASQELSLRSTLLALLKSDDRFVANIDPFSLLRFFEQNPYHEGRDHYFHTFNILLLGYLVIDRAYQCFQQFRDSCLPGAQNWSIEYSWLLTAVFHDVGYPIQKLETITEMVFGVPAMTGEQAAADRRRAWDTPTYVTSRIQLMSIYDHLTQEEINSDWSADVFPLRTHPLDTAFGQAFVELGHGVASAMRMLAGFFPQVQATALTPAQRQFLLKHIFVSGLSIPFHDRPVRNFLRQQGIVRLRTSRFPLATLLMFIDSIQEDRRGRVQEPDILVALRVEDCSVTAEMNLTLLTPEKLAGKKQEALDIRSFLEEDLLRFIYSPDLT